MGNWPPTRRRDAGEKVQGQHRAVGVRKEDVRLREIVIKGKCADRFLSTNLVLLWEFLHIL